MEEFKIAILLHTLLFFIAPFIFGYIAVKIRLPNIVGYILSGIVLSLFVQSEIATIVSFMANIGLILLLFTLGLELDTSGIRRYGKFVLWGGLLQILITSSIMAILLIIFSVSVLPACIIAIGFSLSSTAVVTKLLQERGEDSTLAGQLSIGLLLFQDLAAIPIIVMLTSIAPGISGLAIVGSMALGIAKSILIIAFVIVIGEKGIPFIFEKLSKISRELMNLFVLVFIIACVTLFTGLGLSSALAAFVAGLLIGQTSQHYHVFSQVRPLRDIFVVLFFVFLGASTSVPTLISQLPVVILVACLIMAVKIIVLYFLFTKFHFHTKISFAIGILLSQVGEFAFIIYGISGKLGLLDPASLTFATGVTLVTLILSPFIIYKRESLYLLLFRFFKKWTPDLEKYIRSMADRDKGIWEKVQLEGHIIICGYGRVGSYIGRALKMAEIPFVAIDYNYYTVLKARGQGEQILYGDPTDSEIMELANIKKAFAVISAVPDSTLQEMVLLQSKKHNKDIIVFSRIRHEDQQKRLKDLGAEVIVHPEFEAALSIVRKILSSKHVSKEEIVGKVARLKIEHGMG
ncbi:MAG: cation:proton antiporter [Candidatus Roizmanbacteria bacterium]